MTRDEHLLNEIIQRRGYLVVNSNRPMKAGQRLLPKITKCINHQPTPVDSEVQWYCIAATDLADMQEQVRLMLTLRAGIFAMPPAEPPSYFYRVLSD